MKLKLFRILGTLWLLPVTILVWLFYILPLLVLDQIQLVGGYGFLVLRFDIVRRNPNRRSWWEKRWIDGGWEGLALPHAIIIFPPAGPGDLSHENRHIDQWFLLGPLFPMVYGILHLIYKYKDNPLEDDAEEHEDG